MGAQANEILHALEDEPKSFQSNHQMLIQNGKMTTLKASLEHIYTKTTEKKETGVD